MNLYLSWAALGQRGYIRAMDELYRAIKPIASLGIVNTKLLGAYRLAVACFIGEAREARYESADIFRIDIEYDPQSLDLSNDNKRNIDMMLNKVKTNEFELNDIAELTSKRYSVIILSASKGH